MKYQDSTTVAGDIIEGGVTATAVAVLQQTVLRMIPFLLPAIPLIILDLNFGIKAARHRYARYHRDADRVTFSRGLRGTTGKVFEFACWLILASSMSVAFHKDWIEWATLGIVYVNEIGSIVGNYLCTKDIEFSLLGFFKAIFVFVARWIGSRLGIVTDDVTADDILKPMKKKGPQRNAKGQFTKRKR